jgi:predicted 3-demethylubiquinone-9 3-methyltransferase (glyoxalase superfamily)
MTDQWELGVNKEVLSMQKIVPFLWFDKETEEAMNFYISVFRGSPNQDKAKDSRVVSITRYPEGMKEDVMRGMEGKVLTGIFELAGQRFMALDGGPIFKFNESVSFYVSCRDQEEIDYFWEKLSAVPESEQCGWLKDKYGLSWQIIPEDYEKFAMSEDPETARRVMSEVLKMKKIDIQKLKAAAGK